MRSLILALAVTISPVALTVCQMTCAVDAVAFSRDPTPSCHEHQKAAAGPQWKAEAGCRHGDGVQLVARVSSTQAALIPTSSAIIVTPERSPQARHVTFLPSISPPLLRPPLRI